MLLFHKDPMELTVLQVQVLRLRPEQAQSEAQVASVAKVAEY